MKRTTSKKLYSESEKLTPGGVSSPVRSFAPFPVFMKNGKGGTITDADNNDYIDLCMAYGPLIFGHAHPKIVETVGKQMENGTVFGTPSEAELRLLRNICSRVPCAESARLMNSGTEATMHSIRLARGFTGKNGIVMVNGGFHGAHDALLAGISEDPFTHCVPWPKGVPEDAVKNTFSIEYNDPEVLNQLLHRNKDIAAVIMEPIMGNRGVITPKKGYLEDVRKITSENDVVLIFDEVITGFRVAPDSAQGFYKVTPDLCILGKIIGGGFPAGAVAGKKEIMDEFAPSGKVYQAGTFSGNPITAAAGSAVIEMLTPDIYRGLSKRTNTIVSILNDSFSDAGVLGCVQYSNSMFQVFFGTDSVECYGDSSEVDVIVHRDLFKHMLDSGIYLPPSAFEVNFLCTEHTDEHLSKVAEEFDSFIGGSV